MKPNILTVAVRNKSLSAEKPVEIFVALLLERENRIKSKTCVLEYHYLKYGNPNLIYCEKPESYSDTSE